jgi:hypothetical protein
MSSLIGQVPLQPEIAFMPRSRVGRDDRNEQRAVLDFTADFPIPHIPAPKLALVEPNVDAVSAQRTAQSLCSFQVLRRVAQEYGLGRVGHEALVASRP